MASTIKAELIQLVQALAKQHPKLQPLVIQLKQPKVIIPENKQSRSNACYLIYSIFSHNPELMTPATKELLEQFAHRVGMTPPSPKRHQTTKR